MRLFLPVLLCGALTLTSGFECDCYALLLVEPQETTAVVHVHIRSLRAFAQECADACPASVCGPLEALDCGPEVGHLVPTGEWVDLDWTARDACDDKFADKHEEGSAVFASGMTRRGLPGETGSRIEARLEAFVTPHITTGNLAPCGVNKADRAVFIVIMCCIGVFLTVIFSLVYCALCKKEEPETVTRV